MAIKVAKRARAELGVEPVFVVMLERGAAQHPLFTDSGAQWLRDDPVTFFEVWNPTIYKLYKSAGGWKVHIFSFFSNGLCVYMIIYVPDSRFGSPPQMVWYPRRPPKIRHLHAFQSHNLRTAPYLQHLKAICYLHTTYVLLIVSICFFSTWYAYIQAKP